MNAPNNIISDARNTHMPNLPFGIPVALCSINAASLMLGGPILFCAGHAVFVWPTVHVEQLSEIAMAGRRRASPFERRGFPRVLGWLLAFEQTDENIDDERELEYEKRERRCELQRRESLGAQVVDLRRLIVEPALHAGKSLNKHREENS